MRPAIVPISARQTKQATQFSDSFGDSRTAARAPVDSEAAFQRASDAFPVDTLFDLAPCGYVITTPDGLLVRANQLFVVSRDMTSTSSSIASITPSVYSTTAEKDLGRVRAYQPYGAVPANPGIPGTQARSDE